MLRSAHGHGAPYELCWNADTLWEVLHMKGKASYQLYNASAAGCPPRDVQ